MSEKKNKSDSYQHKIIEISVDPTILNDFPIDDGLGMFLNVSKFSEEFYELRQELICEVLRVVNSELTPRQKEVVNLRLENLTQIEIAEKLSLHQTTIHKIISGNIDYANGKKRYGGALKKLKKLCAKDEKILEILKKMEDLKKMELENEWSDE